MKRSNSRLPLMVLCLAGALMGQTAGVKLPAGTSVDPIQVGNHGAKVTLKPAEQVAFLLVKGIKKSEGQCEDKDNGLGRLCSMAELIQGVHTKGGVVGLTVNPRSDRNYRYSLIAIGPDCIVRALPRHPGLGAFAYLGHPSGFSNTMFFNPTGADLAKAKKINGYSVSGKEFSRASF